MQQLTIQDESMAGSVLHRLPLSFPTARISIEQLIAARVRAEVTRRVRDDTTAQRTLITPGQQEQRLNGKPARVIDVEKQIYVALDAFTKNGFFILVDDEQVETLDEVFTITAATTVSFIKLTPLVGG